MKIKLESPFLLFDGKKHLRGAILDKELTEHQKNCLVLNGQATIHVEVDLEVDPGSFYVDIKVVDQNGYAIEVKEESK